MDFKQVPVGFGMALAMNESAMTAYASMTAQQKQAVLDKARNARSKREMQQIVSGIVTSL